MPITQFQNFSFLFISNVRFELLQILFREDACRKERLFIFHLSIQTDILQQCLCLLVGDVGVAVEGLEGCLVDVDSLNVGRRRDGEPFKQFGRNNFDVQELIDGVEAAQTLTIAHDGIADFFANTRNAT